MSRPLLASRSQLQALYTEAMEARDGDLVHLCARALDGDDQARARCTEAIVEALGNDEVSLSTVATVAELLGLEARRAGSVVIVINTPSNRLVVDDRLE